MTLDSNENKHKNTWFQDFWARLASFANETSSMTLINFQNSQNAPYDHKWPENIVYTIMKYGETF